MTKHNVIYDFMADRFRELDSQPIELEKLLMDAEREGFGEIWDMDKHGMANALQARGLVLLSGTVKLPDVEGTPFDPVVTGYDDFTKRAQDIMASQTVPLEADEIVSLVGLQRAAIPFSNMKFHLKKVGIHYIPGVGYWRYPQYTLEDGTFVSKRCRSERKAQLVEVFRKHGWPITGRDATVWSEGFVTSRYLVKQAQINHARISGLGSGLYVPRDQTERWRIPMSRNVVERILSIDPRELIRDKPELRIFRILLLMERKGMATLARSRSSVGNERCQTLRAKLTKEGRETLERMSQSSQDEF